MNRKGDKSLIVGLDIGTSKVVALVGEYTPGEPIEVIGIGSHAAHGLKRGVVVDIESTVNSIQRAVEEAEESGVTFYHIGVGRVRVDPLNECFGVHRSQRVVSVRDLPRVMAQVHERLRAA